MITLHATIHDGSISLLPNSFAGDIRVDPIWISPHRRIYLAKLYRRTCVIRYGLLELRAEFSIVQEHVWVVEPSVEMSLY